MGNTYRVAHVGTGYTGSIALRQILRAPHLQLVGQLVHSHQKAGRDSGELVGEPPVGVLATDSMADFLALDADCVSYFGAVAGRADSRHRRSVRHAGQRKKRRHPVVSAAVSPRIA